MTPNSFTPLSILVVVNCEETRRFIRMVLGQLGVGQIDEVAGGVDALAKLRAARFDAIISDWEMPMVDGLELLRRVRAAPSVSHTPFILVVPDNNDDWVLAAVQAGVTDCIVRPITSDALEQKLTLIAGLLPS